MYLTSVNFCINSIFVVKYNHFTSIVFGVLNVKFDSSVLDADNYKVLFKQLFCSKNVKFF
jgi:hypothetical protein